MTVDISFRDLSAEVTELTVEIEQHRKFQIQAEAERQSAQSEYDRAIAKLKEDFGIDTLEDAQRLLSDLNAQLSSELSLIRSQLEKAGENNVK